MIIEEEEIIVSGVDTMWKYEPGKCDSEVSRATDDNNIEWIEVKKTLIYGSGEETPKIVQETAVYLEVWFGDF